MEKGPGNIMVKCHLMLRILCGPSSPQRTLIIIAVHIHMYCKVPLVARGHMLLFIFKNCSLTTNSFVSKQINVKPYVSVLIEIHKQLYSNIVNTLETS